MPAADVTLDTPLPEVLRQHPAAREVFDRYGLRGCGGPEGPAESVGFFARAHGVPADVLLAELSKAMVAPGATAGSQPVPLLADTLYRHYFTAAIITVLTAGATWGAWILIRIGLLHSFTTVGLQDINAHGQTMIYGWLGLFVMGFACHAFPRFWHTELAWPKAAIAALAAMLAGILLRAIGMPLGGPVGVPLAFTGGALQLAASAIFAAQILVTFARRQIPFEPYMGFVIASLFFFVAQAGLDLWHTYATLTAATRDDLLWHIATFQAPLRDMQIHGLALLMILGVCLRVLPPLFGVPATSHRRAAWGLGMLVAAVCGEVSLFLAYRFTDNHVLAAFLMIPWILLLAGVITVAWPWKLWRPLPNADRSAKFIRTAYLWLIGSLIMLLLLPAYMQLVKVPFSHAYYGAIRHAITVGFVSLMIMGMASKVVPVLNGVDPRRLSSLWGPFVLINVGCFLRVSLQTLTDFFPHAYNLIGISGTLEVTALAWWGFELIRVMRQGQQRSSTMFNPQSKVAEIFESHPQTHAVFERFGFGMLANPVMRKTVARSVTVAQATAMHSVDMDEFIDALNQAVGSEAPKA